MGNEISAVNGTVVATPSTTEMRRSRPPLLTSTAEPSGTNA
jgi:hypothetical protein